MRQLILDWNDTPTLLLMKTAPASAGAVKAGSGTTILLEIKPRFDAIGPRIDRLEDPAWPRDVTG